MVDQGGGITPGISEELLTARLNSQLQRFDPAMVMFNKLNTAEAPDRLALHVVDLVERTVRGLS